MARSTPRDVRPQTQSTERTNDRDIRSIPNSVLSYLGDEEPIGVQRATPSQLDRRLRDVAPAELIRRPAPEKWSIAEIVAHLADAELAMGWRLRNMLANPGVALTWWDEAAWAERLGYAHQDASFSAGVFRTLRESNLRLLDWSARTVGGVLWGPRGTRTANRRGVRPPGSGTRLEPSSAGRPHLGWLNAVVAAWLPMPRRAHSVGCGVDNLIGVSAELHSYRVRRVGIYAKLYSLKNLCAAAGDRLVGALRRIVGYS